MRIWLTLSKEIAFWTIQKPLEVLRTRIAIGQGLTGNETTTVTNQYRFTRTFLNGEALRSLDLKLIELRHKTVSNLILVMDHTVTYFGPKECLSKQKRWIRYKMEKPRNINTRQYVGLVSNLNSRLAQMPRLLNYNQQLDEYELVDSFAKKAPRSHKSMMISQSFNTETGDLETFIEHWKRAETRDNIAMA